MHYFMNKCAINSTIAMQILMGLLTILTTVFCCHRHHKPQIKMPPVTESGYTLMYNITTQLGISLFKQVALNLSGTLIVSSTIYRATESGCRLSLFCPK